MSTTEPFADDVPLAVEGDSAALERLVRSVQPMVSRLALRFFGCPDHAKDACQEVLVQVVTKLDQFSGESAFSTWVYRVACNKFLSMARSPAERHVRGFEDFDRDLAAPIEPPEAQDWDVDRELLLAEVRIGCTLAMLLCLDRESRLAYVLGSIVELDHNLAADILGCTPATYRKRLERARDSITRLMRARCGLFDEGNHCRCDHRAPIAISRGHVRPDALVFATSSEQVRAFPAVLDRIRRLEELQRAGAIYQSHPDPSSRDDFARRLRELLDRSSNEELGGGVETPPVPG